MDDASRTGKRKQPLHYAIARVMPMAKHLDVPPPRQTTAGPGSRDHVAGGPGGFRPRLGVWVLRRGAGCFGVAGGTVRRFRGFLGLPDPKMLTQPLTGHSVTFDGASVQRALTQSGADSILCRRPPHFCQSNSTRTPDEVLPL